MNLYCVTQTIKILYYCCYYYCYCYELYTLRKCLHKFIKNLNVRVCVCVFFCPTVMSNYHHQAAAVAAQGFGPPASPHTGGPGNPRATAFPPATSPGPGAPSTMDMYSSNPADYVQAASPQPSAFPAIAVSRAPINYNPVGI